MNKIINHLKSNVCSDNLKIEYNMLVQNGLYDVIVNDNNKGRLNIQSLHSELLRFHYSMEFIWCQKFKCFSWSII